MERRGKQKAPEARSKSLGLTKLRGSSQRARKGLNLVRGIRDGGPGLLRENINKAICIGRGRIALQEREVGTTKATKPKAGAEVSRGREAERPMGEDVLVTA